MTPEMLAKARAAAAEMGAQNVDFVEAEAEQLPFADASFDVVISNGVIDLIPDKDAVFVELYRVLAPGRATSDRRRHDPEPGKRGRAGATSTSGPAELLVRCWKQRTPSSCNDTASSESRRASSSTRTRARSSRTRAARRRSSAPAAPPSRPTRDATRRFGELTRRVSGAASRRRVTLRKRPPRSRFPRSRRHRFSGTILGENPVLYRSRERSIHTKKRTNECGLNPLGRVRVAPTADSL